MIDMSDRPDVHVRLIAIKFLFRHFAFFSSTLGGNQVVSVAIFVQVVPTDELLLLYKTQNQRLTKNRGRRGHFAVPCTLAMISSETDRGASS
jgi:hypothetical protein